MNRSVAELARVQHGLVAVHQARDLMSHAQIRHRVRSGAWEQVRRGVYRIAGTPESWEQTVLAACLAVPHAVASFRCAAALWELEGFAHCRPEITVPGRERHRVDAVTVHDSTVTGKLHVAVVHGIPVTSVARTLCDLTAVARPWIVERAVDEALRRSLLTLPRLRSVADDLEGRGRRRCTAMREILEHRIPGFEPGESAPERRIAELLVRAGLPEPTMQHSVRVGDRRYRIDLCYPNEGIAIEYDGWDYHRRRQAFDADRARANDLVVLGLTVLRFTSRSSDQAIVDTVSAALTRARVS